jgi:hypothetical protein
VLPGPATALLARLAALLLSGLYMPAAAAGVAVLTA